MKLILSLLTVAFLTISPLQNEAKATVTLVCPNDVWLNCGAEIWNLSIYGQAYYTKNGYTYDAGLANVVYNLSTCETGKIYRTWQAIDENYNIIECTQTITVAGGHFNYSNINWPDTDLQLYGCNVNTHPDNLPEGYGRPSYDYLTCSMVGTSFKDQAFNFGPDCKKILRTWTILDWCNYGGGGSNPGIWTFVQTIKISGIEQPILSCAKEVTVTASNCYGAQVNVPLVQIEGQGCYSGYKVTNDSRYADNDEADASGNYPIGKTTVNYTIEYSCGKELHCQADIIVKDKAPVPYCLSDLNVALMPVDTDLDGNVDDGMVEVWAKDLDYASYHPCNNAPLKFSFSSDVNNAFRVFTCLDVGKNDLQLWVTDVHGNQAWCGVTIDVQNNAANIPDCEEQIANMAVNGIVANENFEPLQEVYINLKSKGYITSAIKVDTILTEVLLDSFLNQSGTMVYAFGYEETYVVNNVTSFQTQGSNINILSDSIGRFGTNDVDAYRNYNITAFKVGDISRIDETDIARLESYLNEEIIFTNPYSYIASDIDEDGYITHNDLSLLKDLYSGEEDEWPEERQWVFYNREDFNEVQGNPLTQRIQQRIILKSGEFFGDKVSFVGILKGDISAYESTVAPEINIESRNNLPQMDDILVSPNPFIHEVVIHTSDLEDYIIQFFTTDGRLIHAQKASGSKVKIDTNDWMGGTYLYSIKTETTFKTGKIIKF